MSNRINNWTKCDHSNLTPIWFIDINIYIFWCRDCKAFILRDFNNLTKEENK